MNVFTVTDDQSGKRLDVFLIDSWEQAKSRSDIQRAIKAGEISIDGKPTYRASIKVHDNQVIRVTRGAEATPDLIVPANIPLNVDYEDDDIAVIDKPFGMIVHPGAGHTSNTLVNAAAHLWPRITEVGEPDRPGIVHRLDRDTSGLMVIALNDGAYAKLSEMIRDRKITRIYTALVHGIPEPSEGVVDAPIGRDQHHRTRQAISEAGRPSRTHYRVEYELGELAFLEVRLETGRMHQIRVHMAAVGHPVVGDQTYGKRNNSADLNRQFLHASKLEFDHPISGEPLSFASELPDDLQQALDTFRN